MLFVLIPIALGVLTLTSLPCRAQSANRDVALHSLPPGSKRFALVIGVNEYQDSQITSLAGASKDAKSIAEALVSFGGFPTEQVTLLASDQPPDRHPTRGNILRRLSNLR